MAGSVLFGFDLMRIFSLTAKTMWIKLQTQLNKKFIIRFKQIFILLKSAIIIIFLYNFQQLFCFENQPTTSTQLLSFMSIKNEASEELKLDLQISENIFMQNNDSNKYVQSISKNPITFRKTSKRKEAQQEKAALLDLFKDLLKVVNEKFQNAYTSPPKTKLTKLPKLPKITKNFSMKNQSRKEQNFKKKEENISVAINHFPQEKSQSRELNHMNFPLSQIPNFQQVSSPSLQPFHSFNSTNHAVVHARKSSQSHGGHRQKSLNEKHNALKEALKKQIFENYFMSMKYIIHEDLVEQIEEERNLSADHGNRIIDQSSQLRGSHQINKSVKNQDQSHKFDDLQMVSQEEEMHQYNLQCLKDASRKQNLTFHHQRQEEKQSQSLSSSSEENKFYHPLHSEVPIGHSSTTQQFLQQQHPVITNLLNQSEYLTAQRQKNQISHTQHAISSKILEPHQRIH